MKFNGSLNYYFAFDIRYTEAESWDCTIPNADVERIFEKIKQLHHFSIVVYVNGELMLTKLMTMVTSILPIEPRPI